MESSIKIDFSDGKKGLQPFISVKISGDGSDPRDKLLYRFFESLGSDSSWLRVAFQDSSDNAKYISIHPIEFGDLKKEADDMISRITVAER